MITAAPQNTSFEADADDEHEELSEGAVVVVHTQSFARFNRSTAALAHPLIWVAAGFSVFSVAWLFPSSAYEYLFGDRNFMFMHQDMLLFNSCCIAMTVLGIWVGLGGTFAISSAVPYCRSRIDECPTTGHGVLVSLILLNLASTLYFASVGGLAALRASLLTGESFQRLQRDILERVGSRWWLMLLLFSLVYAPVAYQMYRSPARTTWTRVLCWLFALTYVVAAVISMRRNFLARPLIGILLCYLVWPKKRDLSRGRAIGVMAGACVGMVMFFLFAASLRHGLSDALDGVREIGRYLLAPYNTEALILDGSLVYEGGGHGYYWTQWFWSCPGFEHIFKLPELYVQYFGEPPPSGALERSPFLQRVGISTGSALPTFAQSYVDFGWFGIAPFFVVAVVTGWLWRGFLKGGILSTLLYPMAAYSIMEWRSNIGFPHETMVYALYLFAAISFACYVEKGLRR